MKKILVVLLILAVAGGVFAQGNWSLGGNVKLGANIDFTEDESYENPTNPRFSPADFGGELGVNYGLGGISAGLTFKATGPISAKMGFAGDNYNLGAEGNLNSLFGLYYRGDAGGNTYNWDGLYGAIFNSGLIAWGDYLFLDGLVKLTGIVNADKGAPWVSNTAFTVNSIVDAFDRSGDVYENLNGRSGLLVEMNFTGINFGVGLRSLPLSAEKPFFWESPYTSATNTLDFFEDVLAKMIFGMKFNFDPIDIAAQFNIEKLGAYLGLNWGFTDVISAGLSFMGELRPTGDASTSDYTNAAFGASVGYDTGVFGLTLKGGYGYAGLVAADNTDDTGGIVAIAPEVWFKVIPSHLYAKLATKFEFGFEGFGWKFEPGLWWNFKGDGAGDDPGTGIVLKYTLAKPYGVETLADGTSLANIGFRWNF